MRKSGLLISMLIMLFSLGIHAQVLHLHLPDTTVNTGDTILLPITASGFEEIVSMQFSISWDSSIIEYLSFELADLQYVAIGDGESENGILRFSWFDIMGMGHTLEDGSTVLWVRFLVLGEEGDFTEFFIADEPLEVQIFQATETIGIFEPIELEQDSGLVSIGIPIEIMLSAGFEIGEVSCYDFDDGFINLNLETNVPSYTVNWTGPETFSSESESINDLVSGDYNLQITSGAGAILFDTTLTIIQPETPLQIDQITTDTSDCNQDNGTLAITASGGSAPYTYDIGNGPSNLGNFENLAAGAYFLTITDANQCILMDTAQIAEPEQPEIQEIIADTTDCDQANGQAIISASGGLIPYSYDIGNGTGSNNVFSDLAAATYTVTITDGRGCTVSDNFEIAMPPLPEIEMIITDTAHCNVANGTATISLATGSAPFNFDIGTEANATGDFSSLGAGTYALTITDNFQCEIEASFTITEPSPPSLELGQDVELCGDETAEIAAGDFDLYEWSTGENTGSIIVDQAGTYSVTITNEVNCQASDTLIVALSDGPALLIENDLLEVCPGDSIQLLVSGGDVYQWIDTSGTLNDLNSASPMAQPLTTTGYTVISSNSCGMDSVSLEIDVFEFNAGAGPDTCIAVGTTANLSAFGGDVYFWLQTPYPVSQVDSPNPTTEPKDSSLYTVLITDGNGCQTIDSMIVLVAENPEVIKAINMITPNGDGKNDVLEFSSLGKFNANSLKIYNRWGGLVYQKVNYQIDEERFDGTHNGKPLPAGNYFYVLSLRLGEIKQTLTIVR